MSSTTYTCNQIVDFEMPNIVVTMDLANNYTLDTSRFTPRDLAIFVESLETISRLERERHENREKRRQKRMGVYMPCISPTPSEDETTVCYFESKEFPSYISMDDYSGDTTLKPEQNNSGESSDEAYNSGQNSPRNSVRSAKCETPNSKAGSISSIPSDSEPESGVYLPMQSIRPRSSQVIPTKPRKHSTRSRIISMVLKRDYAKALPESESLEPQDIAAEQLERCDRMLNETIQKQFETLTIAKKQAKGRKRFAGLRNTPEKRFLDKALSFLTL